MRNYSLKELSQTKIGVLSGLWGQFSFFAKDQIPKGPLGFGLREDQNTSKTKPELALSQTP